MPPVLWCVYRYFTTTEEMRNSLPNLILIGGFFLHYINRCALRWAHSVI